MEVLPSSFVNSKKKAFNCVKKTNLLRYYKINDPYRIITVFLVLFVLRLLYWFGVDVVDINFIRYIAVGERLGQGPMYVALQDNMAPFAAWFYYIMVTIFGKSTLGFSFVSLILLVFQCFLINHIFNSRKSFVEYSFLPGVIFGVINSLYFGMNFIHPIMLANTFVILALGNIMSQIEFKVKSDEDILNIGVYLGIASLFYFPYVFFLLFSFAVLIVFTSTIVRRYFLIIFGFLLVHGLVGSYFLIKGSLAEYWKFFYKSGFVAFSNLVATTDTIYYYAPLLFFLVVSVFIVLNNARFNNYQQRLYFSMLLFLLLIVISVVWLVKEDYNIILIMAVPITFLLTHYFLCIKRKWIAEVMFGLFAFLPWLALGVGEDYIKTSFFSKENGFLVVEESHEKQPEVGTSLWVIGTDLSGYVHATAGSRFIHYNLYKNALNGLDDKDQLQQVYAAIIEDRPERIVDQAGMLPKLFDAIPALQKMYVVEGNEARINN